MNLRFDREPELQSLIVVDIGNTRIKWARLPSNKSQAQGAHWEVGSATTAEAFLHKLPSDPFCTWCVSRVNERVFGELAEGISRLSGENQVLQIGREDLPISIETEEPTQVGMDRLLGAIAAGARKAKTSAAITIDFGTATTVNAISAAGSFLGGAILPGIQTQFDALGTFTEKIPTFRWAADRRLSTNPIGRDTASAVRQGIAWGHVGAVRILIDRFQSVLECETECFLTGGGFPDVSRFSDYQVEFVPALVLEGIVRTLEHQNPSLSLPSIVDSSTNDA